MLVSIIIPVHKTIPFFKDCVASVLQQSYKNLEIIIACNGGLEVSNCKSFLNLDDKRFVFIKTQNGRHHARNEAMGIAKGAYIQFLDFDDVLLTEKIEQQIAIINTVNTDAISISKWKRFSDTIEDHYVFPFNALFDEAQVDCHHLLEKLGKYGGFLSTVSFLFPKKTIAHIKWIDSPNDDAVFFSEVCKINHKICMVDVVLAGYRIHQNNTSSIRNKSELKKLLASWKLIANNIQPYSNANICRYIFRAYLYLIAYSKQIAYYKLHLIIVKSLFFAYKSGLSKENLKMLRKAIYK